MTWYPATFDTAQFDYSYFDITDKRWVTIKSNHDSIIDKDGEEVTVTKVTETRDAMGIVTGTTETSDTGITVKIQHNTEDKRDITGRGVITESILRCYAKRSYNMANNGTDAKIEIGDKIILDKRGGYEYKVEDIEQVFFAGAEVFRKLILRRIDT